MKTWTRLLFCATALTAVCATPALAAGLDEPIAFNIAPGSLDEALIAYSSQADLQVISASNAVRGKQTRGVEGATTPREALVMLLQDSGLTFVATSPSTVTVTQGEQAGGGSSADATVDALIVTAQKREENIQDVPIAISAFTQKDLEEQKIEGGFDLLKAIPNVTFSKNNFTSYNFSIRGIGTKAVSATTDPGVAVSFNNTALLQNRLFEQEYFDIERVEVLRGPQGTLYGRNATAGVVNVITAKPDMNDFKGSVKGEVGNYQTRRLVGMLNVPLLEDRLAVRLAGAWTQRQGYDFNEGTGNAVNGRDLWSARLTLAFDPTERLRTSLIWERFEEDDDRSRTGKQLCHHDAGPLMVGATSTQHEPGHNWAHMNKIRRSIFSQGCAAGSLYDPMAFGTPNGLSSPFIIAVGQSTTFNAVGAPDENGIRGGLISFVQDPYGGMMQSTDMRVINSIKDPTYRAKADVVQLNVEFDLSDSLTVYSQTVYNEDSTYSTQDFNRFNTFPIFDDTSTWTGFAARYSSLAPGGYFNDPQLGPSNKLVGFDQASATGEQFGQELRLQSSFDGPLNFSLGANYTRFETLVDYYVFNNLVSALALLPPVNFSQFLGAGDPLTTCRSLWAFTSQLPIDSPLLCPYVDPNPLESIDGEGHNYFRSKNPYDLVSTAAFGEIYWDATANLKVTAGLRYTDDRKTFTPIPSQLLLFGGSVGGGDVSKGYPARPDIEQHWGEWTGRLGVDWKPELWFTNETMIYAFYSRGYKGGGANPPEPGFGSKSLLDYNPQTEQDIINSLTARGQEEYIPFALDRFRKPVLRLTGVEYGRTFEPEFVNAFEVGAKNTLLDGALMANANGFFYDYNDYQVSQIRDRTAVNENFDARIWGLEFEGTFAPSRNLQFRGALGYLDTSIGDGEESIDIMNRNQSNPDFVVVKPWMQLPSNCVVPRVVVERYLQTNEAVDQYWNLCGGTGTILDSLNLPVKIGEGAAIVDPNNLDPVTGNPRLYDPFFYDGQDGRVNLHGGAGIAADLSGKELPNAPHWTVSFGGQYTVEPSDAWKLTVRADTYWQSQSWARVYNAVNDKLHGWYNVNLSAWLEFPEHDLKVEFYAKNILDKTPITDAFINSDDTSLTTNVFVLDPRLIGLSVRKEF